MRRKKICKLYQDGKIPLCAQYLNNDSPIIKDGKLIFRNLNRLFLFLTIQSKPSSPDTLVINIQISLKHYLIGLFLHNLLQDPSKYQKDLKIDSNPKINSIIHKIIQKPPKKLNTQFDYFLTLSYSNQNAILNPLTYSFPIKPLLFYLLLILNRIENHPGLFFINNDFVIEDTINFALAALHLELPFIALDEKSKY